MHRVLRTGEPWDALPADDPPWPTVYRWFRRLRADGTWDRLNTVLVMADRERAGRAPQPTGCVLDSQSAKAGGCGVAGPPGYDPGKRVTGRKRVVLVDTDGRLLLAGVASADRHDTRLGAALLRASRRLWPFLARCWVDAGFAGPRVAHATQIRVTTVKAAPGTRGFAVQPRGWVVERSFGALGRHRRRARDHEGRLDVAAGMLTLASAFLLIRRLAHPF